MIDTGSRINIINQKHVPESQKIFTNDLRVVAYNGSSVNILGFVETNLIINGANWGRVRFYVVNNGLSSILGTAAMEDLEIDVCLTRKRLIQSGPIKRLANIAKVDIIEESSLEGKSYEGRLKQTMTFKPRSEILVDLEIPDIYDTCPLFFEKSCLGKSLLEIIPSFQIVSEKRPIFTVLVINPSDCPIKIEKNTRMVELYEAVEIAKIDNQKKAKIFEKIKVGKMSPEILREFEELIEEYSFLFLESGDFIPACSVAKFSVDTFVDHPVNSMPYRCPFALREEMQKILKNYLEQEIIEPCLSPWASPALLVKKKDASWRLVIDYRKLNAVTYQFHHPLPSLQDSLSYLQPSQIYSSVDLYKGYHQVCVESDSKDKTSFVTEFGSYRFTRMPMGLKNSPTFFMKIMDKVLEGVPKNEIICYMDDLCVHAANELDHLINLRKLFQVLATNNLRLNIKKCNFFERTLKFCGFEISDGKVKPAQDRIEGIKNLKEPTSKSEATSVFGMLNFHRNFVPNFAKKALPITSSYRGVFRWTEEASRAFSELVEEIGQKALDLSIAPITGGKYVLETDASEKSYGAVLYLCSESKNEHNHCEKCLRPIGYFSGNFTDVQYRYTILEKELLAVRNALNKWGVYLKFRTFDLLTDNGNVKYANSFRTNNNKIQRWLADIQSYDYRIIQKRSAQMKISDCLSRSRTEQIEVAKLTIEKNDFVELQKLDKILSQVRKFVSLDRWPRKVDNDVAGFQIHRKFLKILDSGELVIEVKGDTRSCVPECLQNEIIKEYHESTHVGVEICYKKISAKYFWVDLRVMIADFIRTCVYCQINKPNNRPNKAPVKTFSTPDGPFQEFGFDLIGPLEVCDSGNTFVLTGIDFFSRKGYCEPLKSKQAHYLLRKFTSILFRNPVFPKSVLFDNGREFMEIRKYCAENGIEVKLAPPRHPQTNGSCENLNRTLKSRLRARCDMKNWDLVLFEVLHEMNASVHSVTKLAPFTIETGIKTPHVFQDANWRTYSPPERVELSEIKKRIDLEKKERVEKFANEKFVEYKIGEKVLISNFRAKKPPFLGPFEITEKTATKYSCQDSESGQTFVRHANNLKKFNERVEIEPQIQVENVEKESQNISSTDKSSSSQICSPCLPVPEFFHPVCVDSPLPVDNLSQVPDPYEDNYFSGSQEVLEKSLETILSDLSSEEVDEKTETGSTEISVENDEVELEQMIDSSSENSSETRSRENSSEESEDQLPSPIVKEIQNVDSQNLESFDSDLPRNPLLENVTETDTSIVECDLNLTSYDALDLSEFPNVKKRTREKSKDSEISYTAKKINLVHSDNLAVENEDESDENESSEEDQSAEMSVDGPNKEIDRNLILEGFKDQIISEVVTDILSKTLEVRKLAVLETQIKQGNFDIFRKKASDSDNDDNKAEMSICVKLEYEHEELFQRIQDEFDSIKHNCCFERGIMLKLNELTKEILQFICSKFKIEIFQPGLTIKEKRIAQLRLEIKDFIRKNHPNWQKSNSGEFLFFGIFFVARKKTIHELTLPELKCLASSLNLFSVVSLSKAKLLAAISKHFSENVPLHPRNDKNELIFCPDTEI
jgi:hypothetical protein